MTPERQRKLFLFIWGAYLLVGMHIFTPTPGGSGLDIPVNMIGWMFAAILTGFGLWQVGGGTLVLPASQKWFWLAALLLALPMAYPGFAHKDHAIPQLLAILTGGLLLLSLYQWRLPREQRMRLLLLLVGAVAIEALYGLVQFYLVPANNWIGYDKKLNYPWGIFRQRNVMASFMATGLAVSLYLLASAELTRLRNGLLHATLALAAWLIVLLDSRTGQLGGILAVGLLLPALRARGKGVMWKAMAAIAIGLAAGITSRIVGEAPLREAVIGYRLIYWEYCVKLILASPWTGYGYGGFEGEFLRHYLVDRAFDPRMPMIEYSLAHPHNEVLFWGVEGGIAPLAAFAIIVAAFFAMLRSCQWRARLALLGLVAPLVLHTQTELPFYHSTAHWIVMLLLVFHVDSECGASREIAYRTRLLPRFLAVLIPGLVLPFMVGALQTAWLVIRYEREGLRNPLLLLQVKNPLAWKTRFEYHAQHLRLNAAIGTHDVPEIEGYIRWARDFVDRAPRPEIYANIVIALDALGRTAEAAETRTRALQLFPANRYLLRPPKRNDLGMPELPPWARSR